MSETNPTTPPNPEELADVVRPGETKHDGFVPLEETRIPPELQEWAREQFREEEFLREYQKVQEQGGLAFEDFFDELVEEVKNSRGDT